MGWFSVTTVAFLSCINYLKLELILFCSGFVVSSNGSEHIFKPVSVQAMWYVHLFFSLLRDDRFMLNIFVTFTSYMYVGRLCKALREWQTSPTVWRITLEVWPTRGCHTTKCGLPPVRRASTSGELPYLKKKKNRMVWRYVTVLWSRHRNMMEDLLSKRNDRDNLVYVAPATQPVVCFFFCCCM